MGAGSHNVAHRIMYIGIRASIASMLESVAIGMQSDAVMLPCEFAPEGEISQFEISCTYHCQVTMRGPSMQPSPSLALSTQRDQSGVRSIDKRTALCDVPSRLMWSVSLLLCQSHPVCALVW
jgi:hypothetical protein